MSSTASTLKRPLPSRLRAHARKAAIPAMLLSITIGGVGVSTTAHAASAPSCTTLPAATCPAPAPWRGAQPSHIADHDWRSAVTAADFWNRHNIDTFHGMHELVTEGNQHYYGGWPGSTARSATGWYHWRTGSWLRPHDNWIWYGGEFGDRNHRISDLERRDFNVPAHERDGANHAYREYDMLGYTTNNHPGTGSRGKYRIVRNINNGHVYATFDHYATFHYLGRW